MTFHLPTFQGYTVDVRLKEFRKADLRQGIEFVSFGSPKGEKLLEAYIKTLNVKHGNNFQILLSIWA